MYSYALPEIAMSTPFKRWALLFTVASGLLLVALDNSILYTALPSLERDLGATRDQALWIINAYPLVMAGLLLGAGTLGDRIGHRRMFAIGLWIFGLASVAAAFSPSANALIGARAALAVGAAAMMPATLALIRVVFTDTRERNLAIAIWGSVALVGAALGPVIGGLLLARFWWGSVFLVNVPVVAIALVATPLLAPRGRPQAGRPWDAWSSVLALLALSGLVLGIKSLASAPPDAVLAVSGAAAFVLAGAAFVRRQARLPHPLLDFALLRHPGLLAGVLAAAFTTFGIGGLQLVTTQRFQLVEGLSPLHAGLLVSTMALGALPAALVGGAVLHRTGLRPLMSGGLALAAFGAAVLAATLGAGIGWTLLGCLLTGLGLGATISVASIAIVGNVPAHRAGMASAVEEVSYELGALLAVALLGSLMTALYTVFMVLPEGAPAAAQAGLIDALALAESGHGAGEAFVQAAVSAYDRAFVVVVMITAAALAAAAAITAALLRGRYGQAPEAGH